MVEANCVSNSHSVDCRVTNGHDEPLTDEEFQRIEAQLLVNKQLPSDYGIEFGNRWREVAQRWERFVGTIKRTRFPDLDVMISMGIWEDVQALFDGVGMSEFLKKLMIYPTLLTYTGLTMEFLCTMHSNEYIGGTRRITFKVNGGSWELGAEELNIALGCPWEEDFLRKSSDYDPGAFWRQITKGSLERATRYGENSALTTQIRNPTLRYIKIILSNTIFCWKKLSTVHPDELYALWCFVHRRPFDVGAYLITCLERLQSRRYSKVKVGGLISIILMHLMEIVGDEPNDKIIDWDNLNVMDMRNQRATLDMEYMKKSKVLCIKRGNLCFKQHDLSLFPLPRPHLTDIRGRAQWNMMGHFHRKEATLLYNNLRAQGVRNLVNPDNIGNLSEG